MNDQRLNVILNMKELSPEDFDKQMIDRLKDELVQQGRVAEIPKGYSWCMNCDALTPHNKPNKSWYEVGTCVVCDEQPLGELCPNCGWDCEEVTQGVGQYEHIIHHEGCHCKDEEYDGKIFLTNWAEIIAQDFKRDWMKLSPDRTSWCLVYGSTDPKDEENRRQYDLNRRLKDQWIEARDVKCGCPKYIIYKDLNVFDSWSRSVYSMDCMNAMEWGFKIRCPKCGCIWDYDAGNC